MAVSLQQTEQGLRIIYRRATGYRYIAEHATDSCFVKPPIWVGIAKPSGFVRKNSLPRCYRIETSAINRSECRAKTQCLLEGIRLHGLACLPWHEDSEQWLQRWRCAAEWLPELALPAADDATLLASLEQWLLPHLEGLSRLDDLRRLSFLTILKENLSWAQQQNLMSYCPPILPHQPEAGFHCAMPQDGHRCWRYVFRRCLVNVTHRKSPMANSIANRVVIAGETPAADHSGSGGLLARAYNDVKEGRGRYPKHFGPMTR